ncbi:MAG: lysylphosphatidylglycerol synthase transmembrane domain-containing protein [Bdellovibrionota bacterium]
MREKIISTMKLVAKFAFAFGILWYMVAKGKLDLDVVRRGFAHLDDLLGSAALVLVALGFSLFRWKLLLRGQGLELSGSQAVRYGMIGAFFNTTMPGAVSGDLIKAWYVISDLKGEKKTPILTSILLDRVMGVFGLVLVASCPLVFFGPTVWAIPELRKVMVPVLCLFAGVVIFFTYVMLSQWGPLATVRRHVEPLRKFRLGHVALQGYDAWVGYRKQPGIMAMSLLISMGNFLCMVGVSMLCGHAIGETHLSVLHYFLLVPIGLLATAIPVAPAGLGVGHAAFDWLFSLVGSHQGPEVFTMMVTVQIIFNLSGVIFYLNAPRVAPEAVAV